MEEPRLPHTGDFPTLQGPHWKNDLGKVADLPVLRLILQPNGFAVDLTRAETVIGRHSEADLRLPLPDVSRRHCRIVRADGEWQIFDLQSMNGIYVNGEKIEQANLRNNDTIRIGGFTFKVDLRTSPAIATGNGMQVVSAKS